MSNRLISVLNAGLTKGWGEDNFYLRYSATKVVRKYGVAKYCCVLILATLWCDLVRADSSSDLLTLADAERMAVNADPLAAEIKAIEISYREKAVAANSWPDPKLKLGVANLSMETYALDDEAMTQVVVGVSQRIPPPGELRAKSKRLSELAGVSAAEVKNRELQTRLAVRKTWLDAYYQQQAEKLVKQSADVFDQLKEITRFQYRAGRGSQRDVISAQLEKNLLQDKQTDIHTQWLTAMAQLKKWLGQEIILESMDNRFPQLATPPPSPQLQGRLEEHPWLQAAKTRVNAAENGVDYAHAQTWPGWSLDLQYGHRGAERADLGSAMIVVDLPLFTGSRQSREIKASQAELTATKKKMDEQRRQLREQLQVQWSVYEQADTRLSLYEQYVVPEAKQNTEASLNAYQSGVAEFSVLVRAKLTELNSELQFLKLKVDKAKAQAELLYLSGT